MSIQEFKCPACGASLKWESGEQKMKCDYCDNIYDAETLDEYAAEEAQQSAENIAWDDYSAPGELREGLEFYVCKSCGGQISAEATTAATHCPFCDNPVVLDNNVSGLLQPDLIIPFKQDKQAAMNAFTRFCKGKPLLPKDFVSQHHVEEISGLYVPFWLFDCNADGKARYDAIKVKKWREGGDDVTKTDHFMVIREGSAKFEYVPVDGSEKMPPEYMEAIEPFDMSGAVDFGKAYLSGFLADRYDVDSTAAQPRANERVVKGMEKLLRSTVTGYKAVTLKNRSVYVKGGKIRYAMLPVWVLSTKYNGKIYKFAMNGQTGKFVGELPVSRGRFAAFLSGITAGLTLISTIVMFLLY